VKSECTDIITVIRSDNEFALREALELEHYNGGIIYINTPIINIALSDKLYLEGKCPGGIIGIRQPNGEFPIINFEKARKDGSSWGIRIYNSNKTLKNLIIENSGGHGVEIFGENNDVNHVISRYNQYSGFYLEAPNKLRFCYSYRNCDIESNGKKGNGFYSFNTKNTVYEYCFAWDNSNTGFKAIDSEESDTTISYSHSGCWNNGNSDVFSGKYDMNNNRELDKKLLTIQQIIESDPNFESNYYSRVINLENAKINEKPASEWITLTSRVVVASGFQFGSATSPNSKKYADFSVSFEHKSKGFDSYSSQKCLGTFKNCVSFNNKINYQLPYAFLMWKDMWSWGATQADQQSMSQPLNKPSQISSAQRSFISVMNNIMKMTKTNQISEQYTFDQSIQNLN
jgi:hypothetical protein